MFAYQNSPDRLPLRVMRFRRVGDFALIAYPAGFLAVCLGAPGSPPFIAGMAIVLIAFAATLVLSATGTNQIAAGTGAGLDEFETTARLAAHSNAYRWFGAFVSASLALALALVAGMFGLTIDTASDRFLAYFFWVVGYGALLPGWFLARALRSDQPDED